MLTQTFYTTEEENLKGRVNYLESLLRKIDEYLRTKGSIHKDSKAHQEIIVTLGL